MHISRRHLLGSVPALGLAACSTTTTSATTPTDIISEAQAIGAGLLGMVQQVAVVYPKLIPAASLATISNDFTLASTAASALTTATVATAGASTVAAIEGYINAGLNILSSPPISGLIPAPYNTAIGAASIIIPLLEAFVAQYITAPAAATPKPMVLALGATAVPAGTTPAQAVAILQGFAKK